MGFIIGQLCWDMKPTSVVLYFNVLMTWLSY